MSLTLYDANGATKDLQKSHKDLKSIATFKNVVIHDGTWIFYKYSNFNDNPGNQRSWVKFLDPGEHQQSISDFNGSVFLLPQQSEGIILFEHYYYGGNNKYYNSNCDNVNPDFQSNKAGGVSGAIVLGGTFDVYSRPCGGGLVSTLNRGQYPTAIEMNIANDAVQSIRKLN